MSSHVQSLLTKGNQRLYALKILKAHGLSGQCLFNICRATLISGLIYASPAWWEFCSVEERDKLQAIVRKAGRGAFMILHSQLTLYVNQLTPIYFLLYCKTSVMFCTNSYLLRLVTLIPLENDHNRVLPSNVTSSKNFIHRMLYKDIY